MRVKTSPQRTLHQKFLFHSIRVPEKRHFIHSTALGLVNQTTGSGASVETLVLCGLVVETTSTCRGQRGKC